MQVYDRIETSLALLDGVTPDSDTLDRIAAFKTQTGYRGGIIPTYITANGLVNNSYSESLAVKSLTLDDLF